ncbi:LMBR1-domain-containing protein [Hesseltinella vesiculosa]|uniref:LMBR1-domain-containing protein n=1 Tax=Hesseltinella vesiculosa TaxID=101127 RepID=A0A1X2GBJ8_9FUNG|nr:LMBR1-domain-containing protein [Hesseltinella vesiculosa]
MQGTSWIALIFTIAVLAVLVYLTVSYYSNFKRQPWYVSAACLVGWFFPFWIVVLLPMDMASTLYDKCQGECREPVTLVSSSFLYVAWRTIYWTSFCLTWFLIPMMQAYTNTGEFQIVKKLKSALQVNLRFYSIYLVVGIVGLVYLVFKGGYTTWAKLQSFVMAMANSWGLFLVIMFMGYGLVAVPRNLWYSSMLKHRMDSLCKKAPKLKEDCMDSELEFDELAKTINTISHRPIRNDPHLHRMVDQTVQRFPFVKHPNYADADRSVPVPDEITEEYLVDVNRKMILAERMKERRIALWNNLLAEAFYLQDIEANRGNTDRRFHSSLRPLHEPSFWKDQLLRLEWWWVIVFRSRVYRGLSLLVAGISICMLWSELTFNIKSPFVSIVGLSIKACSQNYNYAAMEVVSFLILAWMCACVYTSLFKVRFFNLYLLIPHHHTDPNSLLWFTSYMCKMMAPLCYNFINLLGEGDSDDSETVFSKFMGKANLVPFLGNIFIDWFPVVILIPALSAFFQSHWFGMGSADSADDEEGGNLNVDVAEGLQLIKQERQNIERTLLQYPEPPSGILGRVRNAIGIYTSIHNNGSQPRHQRAGPPPPSLPDGYVGARASSLRQERDQRLDAILRGQQDSVSQPSSPNEHVPLSVKWQTFGESAKGRLEQFFANKDEPVTLPQAQNQPVEVNNDPRTQSTGTVSAPPPPPPKSDSPSPPLASSPPISHRTFGRVTPTSPRSLSPPSSRPTSGRVLGRVPASTASNGKASPFARFGDHAPS